MRQLVQVALAAGTLALLAAPASAQMTMPKNTVHQGASGTQAMMAECGAMMQEVMADPVVRKRMMAIMQKHMQQRAGHGSMMTPGMMGGGALPSATPRSGASSHDAHHPGSVPTPFPSSPVPTANP